MAHGTSKGAAAMTCRLRKGTGMFLEFRVQGLGFGVEGLRSVEL